MGKTKNNKKTNSKKKNKKTLKMKGGCCGFLTKDGQINPNFTGFLSIIMVGIFFLIQCRILDMTYHLQINYLPYTRQLHEWFLIIKNIRTFLNRSFPNNPLTKMLDVYILYIIDTIPNKSIQDAIKEMIPSVIARPNILKQIHLHIDNLKTPENSQIIDIIKQFSKTSENMSEYKRIFNLDLNTYSSMDTIYTMDMSDPKKYSEMLNFVNNYESKVKEILYYLNGLLDAVVLEDPSIVDILGSYKPVKEISTIYTLGKNINLQFNKELMTDKIMRFISTIDYKLQETYNNFASGPTIYEIEGGKKNKNKKLFMDFLYTFQMPHL